MRAGLPLMKNVLTSLAKSVLIPLELTAGESARDAGIQKKVYGSGKTAPIVSNKEMEYIVEIVNYLEQFGLLNKSLSKTIKNEVKEQKAGFLGKLPTTLVASLLGNMLAGKWTIRAGQDM